MNCGQLLEPRRPEKKTEIRWSNSNIFLLTLGGSLLLSWLMIAVFNLPVFFLAAFLPLLWSTWKK